MWAQPPRTIGAMATSSPVDGIRYPVAERGDRLVWASDLASAGERPTDVACIGCAAPVLLRAGTQKRPHFAHRAANATCEAGETVLHRTAIRVLQQALAAAFASGGRYPITVSCCGREREANLACYSGGAVTVEEALTPECRPDLLIRDAEGRPRVAIEVIVTHEPELAAEMAVKKAGAGAIYLWASWDILDEIRTGLTAGALRPTRRATVGSYLVLRPKCPSPRHTTHVAKACTDSQAADARPARIGGVGPCGMPTRLVGLEVSSIECPKKTCKRPVLVVDAVVSDPDGGQHVVAASTPEVAGIAEPAARLGVVLQLARSETAKATYLMHKCPGCGTKQGDFFCYAGGQVDVTRPRPLYRVCDAGHWQLAEERSWPEGWTVERLAAEGLWGSKQGVRTGISVQAAVRRMVPRW